MIVARSFAGRDIGGAILRRAENIARRGGYRWLRLDAWKTNPQLHAYYSSHAFAVSASLTCDIVDQGLCSNAPLFGLNPPLSVVHDAKERSA